MDSLNSSQKGFSLIELMIALAASLFIIAGLFYSVMGDLRSYESARGTQGIASKNRMVAQTFRLYIQQAGFKDLDTLKANQNYEAATSNAWVWEEGQSLQGTTSNSYITDEKLGSDILALRFSGTSDSGIVSCDGTNLLTTDVHEMTLYVNDSNQLMCKDNEQNALLLDEDIEFLELLYGTTDNTTRYYTAAEINDWGKVNRIKVGVLISQKVVANNHLKNTNSYTIFNKTIAASNDSNFRSVLMDTVLLKVIKE